MAVLNWQDIGELGGDDTDSIKRAIVIPAKEALRQTRFALTGNLTIKDNAYAAIVTLGQLGNNTSQTLVHGTEYVFQNPLKTTPVGFTPIKAFDSNRVAIQIPDCKFNTSRPDGLMGITANFAPPSSGSGSQGEIATGQRLQASALALAAATTTTIASASIGAGTWDAMCVTEFQGNIANGTVIYGGPSTGTAFNAGVEGVEFSAQAITNFAGGTRDVVISPSVRITVATITTINHLARCDAANASVYGSIWAVRVIPYQTGITGNVVGILWGG